MKKVFAVTAALALLCMVGVPALAGWTVVSLNPSGAEDSSADGVSGGQQVGYAYIGGPNHAGLWSGTAVSWVDLNPAGATWSAAYGVSGGQQVGYAYIGGNSHAGLWSGTAASWVDLNPAGAAYSGAYGVSGGQQAGVARFGGNPHAGLWSGTAASWVDLNPAGATYSYATGVSGGQQVGVARFGGNSHAGLWSGTAASWVDLNPAGVAESEADGVSGGYQVGYAHFENNDSYHASLWSGTAASWVDLHALLPSGVYSESEATDIYVESGSVSVVGWAYNPTLDRYDAILWHYTAEPAYGISNRAAYDPIISTASAKFSFQVWGKVTILGSNSFAVDDGAGMPVTVVAPGFSGIQNGDYASAKGKFSGEGSNRVLNAQASDVVKLQ